MGLFADWSSMAQGIGGGGGWSSGPLGASGAAGGITGIAALAGGGLEVAGMMDTMAAEKTISSATKSELMLDEQLNNLKQQQAHLINNRQGMENQRNFQKAQANTLAATTNQGGGGGIYSSGYGGARGSEASTAARNALNLNQNQIIGDQSFAINNQIDQYKMQVAGAQSKLAMGQGLSQLGAGLMSGSGNIGTLLS